MKKCKTFVFVLLIIVSLTSLVFADALKNGSKGEEVKKLQNGLIKLGFFDGEATGYYGSQTEAAVKKFQAKNHLEADGIAGPATIKAVFESVQANTQSKEQQAMSSLSKEKLSSIQSALKKLGYYTGTVDGKYGDKTAVAIKAFQKDNSLTSDGIVGPATEAKLLGKSSTTASKGKVELLDWWTQASKIFKIGSIATVTDVKTGKKFKLKRTYGHNHADCETLTAQDTKIMKQIWSGSWSWTRRSVVIEVGGRRIAASIAAMPHAGVDSKPANTYVSSRSGGYSRGTNMDKVKNNNMSGVVDVHFLNSRTHNTNKVDSKHQAAVKQATKYK